MNLMVLSALRAQGVKKLIAVDVRDSRLELARRFGATLCLNSAKQDIVREVCELTDGRFLDSVVEMSGPSRALTAPVPSLNLPRKTVCLRVNTMAADALS